MLFDAFSLSQNVFVIEIVLSVLSLTFLSSYSPLLQSFGCGCKPRWPETTIYLLHGLIIHSSMNLFSNTPVSLYSLFLKSLMHRAKAATFFANFPVNKHPSTSEVICRCRSTYDVYDLVPLVISSNRDSELFVHFQKAYVRLFTNCYNKQGILSNFPSYRPMSQGTIYAKVYSEGVQPIK